MGDRLSMVQQISDKARKPFESPWILMGVIALAALLRFFAIGKDSLWIDEVLSANICREGLAAILRASTTLDAMNLHPPVYHLILRSWMLVFGQSDPALRSLSAIFGTVSVLLVYCVGTELFDRKTGLVAASLLAISPFAIYYSREARPYSLLMLLTLTSFLFFIRLLNPDRQHKADLLCYCIANMLLLYTHAYGLFAVGSQVLYFLIFRNRYASSRRPFWIAQAVTVLVALPWIYLLTSGVLHGTATQGLQRVADPMAQAFSAILRDLWGFSAGQFVLLLLPLCLFLFLAGLFRVTKQGVKTLAGRPRTALLLLWVFVPVVGVVTIVLVFQSIFWSKYVIGVAPAIYLIAARGMANVSETFRARVARVNVNNIFLALVVLLCLPQLLVTHVKPDGERWREVANLIQQESLPDDVILSLPAYQIPFNYYYKGDLEVLTYGLSEDNGELAALVDRATYGKERLWLIIMNYQSTIDAPIKGYLLARYGNESLVIQKDFSFTSVYLFDL
jgi:mannosyltransferase